MDSFMRRLHQLTGARQRLGQIQKEVARILQEFPELRTAQRSERMHSDNSKQQRRVPNGGVKWMQLH